MKRKVTVNFEIVADKLSSEMLRLILLREIKDIEPSLITNVNIDIIYTNK